MKFEELFYNFDSDFDYKDLDCGTDYNDVPSTSDDAICPNQTLSPPISMPSSSPMKQTDFSFTAAAFNDSDLRESNFLRRMHQSLMEDDNCKYNENNSIDYSVQPIKKNSKTIKVSNVKLKLANLTSADLNLQKRINSRRSLRSQREGQQMRFESRKELENEDFIINNEVW